MLDDDIDATTAAFRAVCAPLNLKVFVQDDPGFYEGLSPLDDTRLASAFRYDVDTAATLIKSKAAGRWRANSTGSAMRGRR